MVKFVLEDREALGIGSERGEELRVVKKFKVSCLLADPNTSGRDVWLDTLINTTRELCEERLIK